MAYLWFPSAASNTAGAVRGPQWVTLGSGLAVTDTLSRSVVGCAASCCASKVNIRRSVG